MACLISQCGVRSIRDAAVLIRSRVASSSLTPIVVVPMPFTPVVLKYGSDSYREISTMLQLCATMLNVTWFASLEMNEMLINMIVMPGTEKVTESFSLR